MRQVKSSKRGNTAQTNKKKVVKPKKSIKKRGAPKWHPKYGTSKLEDDFAEQFLDKLKVKYARQFEAKDIGRFYDFVIFVNGNENDFNNGNLILVEIDGSYFHSDPRLIKEEDMSPMQKKNKRVDNYKDKWALMRGIPLIRIWEKDIRENPKEVMRGLKERLYIETEKNALIEKKNKRHVNRIGRKL